jgi:hypothetical protein
LKRLARLLAALWREAADAFRRCADIHVASPEGLAILLLSLIAVFGGVYSISPAGAATTLSYFSLSPITRTSPSGICL